MRVVVVVMGWGGQGMLYRGHEGETLTSGPVQAGGQGGQRCSRPQLAAVRLDLDLWRKWW